MDPAVVFFLMATEHYTPHDIEVILNKQSGILGLSGVSNDMEMVLEEMRNGHQQCKEAVEVYCHRLKKYIGAYQGLLNGADALVFSAGIGENSPEIRRRATEKLDNLGIEIDPDVNKQAVGEEMKISSEQSDTDVWVVPADEELVIARDTCRCLNNLEQPT
jgi:acetate kinase